MMTDKEVGNLWREALKWSDEVTLQLVRKVVEERAEKYRAARNQPNKYSYALRDFGISPDEWTK